LILPARPLAGYARSVGRTERPSLNALDTLEVALCAAHVELDRQLKQGGYDDYSLLVLRRAFRRPSDSPIKPIETNRDWLAVESLQADLTEVEQSVACLRNVPVYLRRFPYGRGRVQVSPADYMQYHLENWLNEVYILRERFKLLCAHVKRRFSTRGKPEETVLAADRAFALVDTSVETIRELRGQHVHQRRYVDREVLLVKSGEMHLASQELLGGNFKPGPEHDARRVRRVKAREIAELNADLDRVVEQALALLAAVLVTGDYQLRVPSSV
jgi:hypothetical protein